MPTISTALAFDNLLHPNTTANKSSYSYSSSDSNQQHHQHPLDYSDSTSAPSHPICMMPSPALYTTPQQFPSPFWHASPPSPSPYVINCKRRGGIIPRPPSSVHNINNHSQTQTDVLLFAQAQGEGVRQDKDVDTGGTDSLLVVEDERNDDIGDADLDDFFEPRDSMSIASSSSSDVEDRVSLPRSRSRHHRFGNSASLSSQSEYYDAVEDFLSDGSVSNSSPSFSTNIHKELKALRLSFIEEVEKRKKAEKDLLCIHMQWQRIATCLSHVGLSFPEIQHSGNAQPELDPPAICQEIIVTRFVSETIERAMARAETEVVTEAIIDSKNHEISRLRDRLQYYEAVNREMSQRNQEAVDFSRRKRLRRKTKRRLIWVCVGLSITVGASLLAHSFIPGSLKRTLPTSSSDASGSKHIDTCGN